VWRYFVGLALGPSQPMLATPLHRAALLLAVTMFVAVPAVQPNQAFLNFFLQP
jgi:hypothetical protein